jgi:hypothetical protein
MSQELIAQLRSQASGASYAGYSGMSKAMTMGANLIEQQAAEIERLQSALDLNWVQHQEIVAARAEAERLRTLIGHAANIAHNGGLAGLDQDEALVIIRHLTLADFDRRETTMQATASVRRSINAALSKQKP